MSAIAPETQAAASRGIDMNDPLGSCLAALRPFAALAMEGASALEGQLVARHHPETPVDAADFLRALIVYRNFDPDSVKLARLDPEFARFHDICDARRGHAVQTMASAHVMLQKANHSLASAMVTLGEAEALHKRRVRAIIQAFIQGAALGALAAMAML
jgi:hypothetical protein